MKRIILILVVLIAYINTNAQTLTLKCDRVGFFNQKGEEIKIMNMKVTFDIDFTNMLITQYIGSKSFTLKIYKYKGKLIDSEGEIISMKDGYLIIDNGNIMCLYKLENPQLQGRIY